MAWVHVSVHLRPCQDLTWVGDRSQRHRRGGTRRAPRPDADEGVEQAPVCDHTVRAAEGLPEHHNLPIPPARTSLLLSMTAEQEPYLAVLKASYDYEPQPDAEDELAIKENQLLFLLERTDEECDYPFINPTDLLTLSADGGRSKSSLIRKRRIALLDSCLPHTLKWSVTPHRLEMQSTHVSATQAEPIHLVKVLYDYDATQATELSVKEDEILNVYDKDEEWLLVASQSEEGRVGYVPGNYVEEVSACSIRRTAMY